MGTCLPYRLNLSTQSVAGFFTIYLYISEGNIQTVVLILWTALAVIVPADILRLRYPPFERLFEKYLGFLMRESEKVWRFLFNHARISSFTRSEIIQWRHLVYPWRQFCPHVLST